MSLRGARLPGARAARAVARRDVIGAPDEIARALIVNGVEQKLKPTLLDASTQKMV